MKLEAALGGGGGCKYHPNNNQLPGVCPFCLRDKLLKLYDNTNPTYPLPCPPPQPFPSYVSRRHRRYNSSVTESFSSMASFNYGLKKSNSVVAFGSRSQDIVDREVNGSNRGSKKRGIWSKLLKLTKKNTKDKETFMHSRTIREGKSWHF